jgi:lysophospholipase L1-like esterase
MKQTLLLLAILVSLKMEAQKQPLSFLALGDSYTIGESVTEAERWPNQLADSLTRHGCSVNHPKIIATTGWRTDNLKNAIAIARLKEEYDLVTLLIGVNNQYQGKPSDQYGAEFEDLLKTAIHLAKEKKENVIVVSIPDYGYTPFGEKKKDAISKAIDEFNAISKKITLQYGVTFVNITDISRNGLQDASLIAGDGLHPSGKMYSLWVERIMPSVKR